MLADALGPRAVAGDFASAMTHNANGLRKDGSVQRRNVVLRRAPQPGIVLGRVQRILTRSSPTVLAPMAHAS